MSFPRQKQPRVKRVGTKGWVTQAFQRKHRKRDGFITR
jgi:hypothetical protein